MLTINKQEISNLLLLNYLSSLHSVREKLRLFENKYHTSWENFSGSLKSKNKEDFQEWDDYIEWKSYMKISDELTHRINEVRHGYFEIT